MTRPRRARSSPWWQAVSITVWMIVVLLASVVVGATWPW